MLRTGATAELLFLAVLGLACSVSVQSDPVFDCRREAVRERYIGISIHNERLYLDPGVCRKVMVPSTGAASNMTTCPIAVCRPLSKRSIMYNLRSGLVKGESIEKCVLDPSPCEECDRQNYSLTVYAGTPYQESVDVGHCGGQCSETDHTCVATSFEKRVVNGPNGPDVITVIKQCSCQPSCYKVDYFEGRYVQNMEQGQLVSKKKYNVGRCTGTCQGQNIAKDKCMAWSALFNRCFFPSSDSLTCAPDPNSMKKENYVGKEGKKETISIIQHCSCLTG